ncbi:nicotinate (nicotinamide) nucleotide adenylyltransferase [Limnohabitans sp. Rim8]|uniref:nicotinate (nicotinamide) nucleotide adenylyltransferase n=1 Tax=Limnohabitans sp. Rim8 TaxID=1100718 RepID=UPI0033064DCA
MSSGHVTLTRLGVYGGAFDPPHLAHRALAQAAVEQLKLDSLLILPTGQAWHKDRALTPAHHRLAMTRLAFHDLPKSRVDDRETRRAGPTYTVDTLRELAQENPAAQLFLVMGADQAKSLHTWHEIEAIYRLAIIAVAERDAPDLPLTQSQARSQAKDPAIQGDFRAIVLPLLPHSATDIRTRVASGQSPDALVCAAVASYIQKNHLYPTAR